MRLTGPWLELNLEPTVRALLHMAPKLSSHWTTRAGHILHWWNFNILECPALKAPVDAAVILCAVPANCRWHILKLTCDFNSSDYC